MAETKIANVSTNDAFAVERQKAYEKGKNTGSSYQALSDYTMMFFENATYESPESGKVKGLSQQEYDQLYNMTKGFKENTNPQIQKIGNKEQRLLENLKKDKNNSEHLKSELKTAQEKYDAVLKDKSASKFQIDDAKKELELKRENIISGQTIEENRLNYY